MAGTHGNASALARSGQVALVVGGTGALGSAIALRLAEEGADVAFLYRSATDKANALCTAIQQHGVQAHAQAVPIEDMDRAAGFVEDVVALWGRIDTLVYASGPPFELEFIGQVKPSDWARVFAADVNGCFNMVHAALPHLRTVSGSIVAVTAAGIERAIARDILSLAPKSAITSLMRGIALEEGRNGVRANCVAPGYIAGGIGQAIMDAVGPEVAARLVKAVPLKRMGTAEEVADAVSYLTSSNAAYITGNTLFVSGGLEI